MSKNRFLFTVSLFFAPPAIVACLELLWNTFFARLPVYWLPFYSPFPAIALNSLIHIAITCAPVLILGLLLGRLTSNRRAIAIFWFFLAAAYAIYMSSIFLRLLWEIRDDPVFHPPLQTLTGGWVLALLVAGLINLRAVLRSPSPQSSIAWPSTLTLSAVIGVTALVLRRPLADLWRLNAWVLLICGGHIVVWVLTRRWRPSCRSLAAGLLAITLIVTLARSFWAATGGLQKRPNLIISLWDATRADRMSLYGCEKPTTPFAEKLADQGVVWHMAYSSANFTFPSHVSIFTGLYGSEHNLWAGPDGYEKFSSLAGELERLGYRTILITENPWVLALNRGFDFYYAPFVRRMSLRWGSDPYRARPFPPFPVALTIPSPFLVRQAIDAIRHEMEGWYKRSIDLYQLRLVGEQLVLRRRNQPLFIFFNWMNVHNRYYPGEDYRTDREVAPYPVREEYDNSVRYADSRFKELAMLIARAGVTEKTIFILTSDHGQMHGEQNIWGHGRTLFDPVLRVPLLVSCPSWTGRKDILSPVTQVRMKPMVLALAQEDYAAPEARERIIRIMADNRGVVAELRDDEPQKDGSFRAGFTYIDQSGKKIIYDPQLPERDGPWGSAETLIFDLATDPAESRNLFEVAPEDTRNLLEQYERWKNTIHRPKSAAPAARYPAGMEKQLRALGYLR